MQYDAVIFDLFGTLVPSMEGDAYEDSIHRTGIAAGAEPGAFLRVWIEPELAQRRMTGRFRTQADGIREVCRRLGFEPEEDAVRQAAIVRANFLRGFLFPRQDTLDTLRRIKEAGLKLGLMSACSPDTPPLWVETPMAPFFDATLLSCEVGVNKPDPRFYRMACERLGVTAGRCLYVGDGAGHELTGARDAGMHPVLICPPGEEPFILTRDGVRDWGGPRLRSLSGVLDLLGLGREDR